MKPIRNWCTAFDGRGAHISVSILVIQNFERLSQSYRIGLYEDLYYASSAAEHEHLQRIKSTVLDALLAACVVGVRLQIDV